MANYCIKKYSTSLGMKEMQIKTSLRLQLTLVKMAIIKKTSNNNTKENKQQM
jgi:hypothetical protein